MADKHASQPVVPFVVAWEGENHYEVRPCRWAGHKPALWQRHAPGTGNPLFEDLHIVRSRRAVAQWLCPICGKATDPSDRFWFGLGEPNLERQDGSHWGFATFNAPNHKRCAEIAAEGCPHLAQSGHKPMRFPTPDAIVAGNLVAVGGSVEATGFSLRPGQTVAGQLFFVWREKPRGAL